MEAIEENLKRAHFQCAIKRKALQELPNLDPASATPCKSSKCGCVAANLACTAFCLCQGSSVCKNEQTVAESDENVELPNYHFPFFLFFFSYHFVTVVCFKKIMKKLKLAASPQKKKSSKSGGC